jgi:hypothetical protein
MKSFLSILLATVVLLFGCESSPDLSVNISDNNTQESLSKLIDYELIPLPAKSPEWIDSVFTMSKEIDGSVGGQMIMEKYFISEYGDSIIIEADLRIPAGAFEGTEIITMTVDDDYAYMHFYPEMIFEDTLKFTHKFQGLNLDEYPTGTIDFVFIANDGSIEILKKNGVQVIVPQGLVRVLNAKLTHFSRYGWVRKLGAPVQIYPEINNY